MVNQSALPADFAAGIEKETKRVQVEVLGPRKLSGRTVLLVGGAGYIGNPLTGDLLAAGYKVRCLDLILYGNEEAVTSFLGHPGYHFMRGDLANAEDRETALEGVTDVIVLAGLVGDPITKKYPKEHELINEAGLKDFLLSLNGRKLNKVVFVSTCSNYGEIPQDTLADEDFPLKPLSLYATAKVSMEKLLLSLRGKIDYAPTILRFATAFGLSGRMRFDLTVSEFTRDLFSGRQLEVYDADTWRPYCHVRDFARALLRVLEAPVDAVAFEVFNAGGDHNNFTKKMIVEAIQNQLGGGEVAYVSGGGDRRNYRVNFAKIRSGLHFEPKFSVEDGVRELIDALQAGFFSDFERRRAFYRNDVIAYG